jgi:CBS domain-containing protein
MERSNSFNLRTISERKLKNKSHHDPNVTVHLNDPLTAATKHFVKTGVHRVCVVNDNGKVQNILSQSDVLKWSFGDVENRLKDLDLEAAQFCTKVSEMYTVKESDVTLEAFTGLDASNHTGAAILDDEMHLRGCFSATDLKNFNTKSFLQLLEPVRKWMNLTDRSPLRFVPKCVKLSAVVKRMVDLRLHRIFVVESADDMTLVGVITISDVLQHLKE